MVISFVIFNAGSINEAFVYIGGMLGVGDYPLVSTEALYYLKDYLFVLIIAIVGATNFPKYFVTKFKTLQWLEPIVLIALLAVSTAYLVDGSFNPFLYFGF